MKSKITISRICNLIMAVLYWPIYALAHVLYFFARIQLGIAYFGMLDLEKGKDIFRYLFRYHHGR